MKRDPLKIFEIFFEPGDGYVVPLINHRTVEGSWTLGHYQDGRVKPTKGWRYIKFPKRSLGKLAEEDICLSRNEVYGYLKANHPELNIKELITKEVKDKLSNLIEEIGYE